MVHAANMYHILILLQVRACLSTDVDEDWSKTVTSPTNPGIIYPTNGHA